LPPKLGFIASNRMDSADAAPAAMNPTTAINTLNILEHLR
jgi:hypothetical protein